jgi:hypothetical protein
MKPSKPAQPGSYSSAIVVSLGGDKHARAVITNLGKDVCLEFWTAIPSREPPREGSIEPTHALWFIILSPEVARALAAALEREA